MLDYSLLYPMTTPTRCSMKLDGMWKFSLDWQGEGEKLGWSKGVPGRDMIPVPASFQDFYTEKAIREYTGDMWYETDITIPVFMRGSDVFIRFGAATHRAWVYLNGELVGEHEGGFLPFLVDITDKAVYGELNRLVVRVNNELNETNIPCGRTIRLENGRKMSKPYFDFYNYSGLQRSVHLIAVPKNSITDVDLSYEIGEGEARINYSVSQKGKGDVSLKLYDEDGRYGIGGISVLIILLLIAVFILVSIFTDLGIWLTLLVTFAIYTIIIVGIALIAVCTSILIRGQ